MRQIIEDWYQDQIDDGCFDFPDDFEHEKAISYLFQNFNSEVIYNHLDNLLIDYLH